MRLAQGDISEPEEVAKRGNSQAQGDTGVWGSRNQTPSLLSSILVGEGDGSDDGSLVIYRETDQINKHINDNESHVSHC